MQTVSTGYSFWQMIAVKFPPTLEFQELMQHLLLKLFGVYSCTMYLCFAPSCAVIWTSCQEEWVKLLVYKSSKSQVEVNFWIRATLCFQRSAGNSFFVARACISIHHPDRQTDILTFLTRPDKPQVFAALMEVKFTTWVHCFGPSPCSNSELMLIITGFLNFLVGTKLFTESGFGVEQPEVRSMR